MLKFIIEGQKLLRRDFTFNVQKSQDYLTAEFEFETDDWTGLEKSAIFANDEKSYTVLVEDGIVTVPYEVLNGQKFKISVFGVKGTQRITTNEVIIHLETSGYTEGETPAEPTEDVYSAILEKAANAETLAQSVVDRADNGEFKGEKGDTGAQGIQGAQGEKGENGVSITKTEIVNGHLIVTMSDGTTTDAGAVNDEVTAVYGFYIDYKTKTPQLTRLGAARYLKAEPVTGDEVKQNDFDDVYPFCDIRRCNLADDGTVNAFEGEPTFKYDGTNGQVMDRFSKYYRYVYYDTDTDRQYRWYSREKISDDYSVPPDFLDANGSELDYIYIGAYQATRSADEDGTIDGVYSKCNDYNDDYSYGLLETNAYKYRLQGLDARGTNWHMMDVWDYDVIQDLWMLEWGTLNSRAVYYGESTAIDDSAGGFECYADEDAIIRNDSGEISAVTEDLETSKLGGTFLANTGALAVGDYVATEKATTNDDPSPFDYYNDDNYDTAVYVIRRKVIKVEEVDSTTINGATGISRYTIDGNDGFTVPIIFWAWRDLGVLGATNEIKSSSGQVYNGNGEGWQPFVWRGLENLFGAEYTYLDGILEYGGKYYVCKNPNNYAESGITDDYVEVGLSFPSASGYISKMTYDETTGLTLPTETDGTSETGFCDNFTRATTTTAAHAYRVGGAGLFSVACSLTSPNSRSYAAARLSYRHYE